MTEHKGRPDDIYAAHTVEPGTFRFDASVADVFTDMVTRSVPGYALMLDLIAVAARRFSQSGTRCYDLGCSLGAATLQLRRHAADGCTIIGIDNAEAMIERAQSIMDAERHGAPVELICTDLLDYEFDHASMFVMNLTLQFIDPPRRLELLRSIRDRLLPGGCLILSEKLCFADSREQALLQDLHHDFKYLQGYSKMEIARKRAAIDNVLIPETVEQHTLRLEEAGFSRVTVWLQCLNFVSLVAEY